MYSANFSFGGQGSAYRFLSVFNPGGSTRNVVFNKASVLAYASVSVLSNTSLTLYRVTAASGGVLQDADVVNKFVTAYPDPAVEVRTTNPTVTTGARLFGFAPPIQGLTLGALSPSPQVVRFDDASMLLAPGEGVCFLQESNGLTGHRYDIYASWTERPL